MAAIKAGEFDYPSSLPTKPVSQAVSTADFPDQLVVTFQPDGLVSLTTRYALDTSQPPVLRYTQEKWEAFITGARASEFDETPPELLRERQKAFRSGSHRGRGAWGPSRPVRRRAA